jgi:hypothetical protein
MVPPNAHDPPGVLLAVGVVFTLIAVPIFYMAVASLRRRADRDLFGFGLGMMSGLCLTAVGLGSIFFAYTWSRYFPGTSPRTYDQDLFTYIAFSAVVVGSVCSFIPAFYGYRARLARERLGTPAELIGLPPLR